jgi:catechol 2,3-dioxygenase-like lactoylglutathione lyase family enzyme
MRNELRADRRAFLKKGAGVVAGATALPLLAGRSAWADDGGDEKDKGELGLVGIDHVGLTVPDIGEAVEWFQDVMGATAPLSFGPISDPQGTLMHDLLGVDPRAVIDQITVLRIGRSANIELFQYEAPDQRRTHPRNSDWSGHHVAFYVTDIDAAVAYMEAKGVQKFLGPFPLTAGPAAGQTINYFKTPFGTYIEFISYPNGMAYQQVRGVKPLWSPKENGLRSNVTTVPGLLGIDHIGITVPDIAVAAGWLETVLGGRNPLTFGPFSDPVGDFMHQLVDVDPRAVVEQIRMFRLGDGPGIELFAYTAPDQDHTPRKNSDWGAHHVAFYVRHIDKAVKNLTSKGAQKRFGPFAVTAGPAAGQTINYFQTPFSTDIELISYPHGMAYEKTAAIPLWNPRDNRH